MSWRAVKSLLVLRSQIDAAHPNRAKGADGTLGDARHQTEASDHNPHVYAALGSMPVVCALDITHDTAHGCDTYGCADMLRQSHDPRIAYIISNHRITGPNHGWRWDPYSGSDPHTGHMHVSTVHTAIADSEGPWHIDTAATTPSTGANMPDVNLSWGETLSQYLHRIEAIWSPAAQATMAVNGKLDTLLKAQGIEQAEIADIQARTGVPAFTDAQITAIGAKVAAAIAAHPGNPLTAADTPVIVAAVKQALREGVGA